MDRTNRRSLSPGVVAQKTRFGLRNQQVVYECGRPLPCRGLLDDDSAESCSAVARLSARYAAGFLDANVGDRRGPVRQADMSIRWSRRRHAPASLLRLAHPRQARGSRSRGETRQRPRDCSEALRSPSRRYPLAPVTSTPTCLHNVGGRSRNSFDSLFSRPRLAATRVNKSHRSLTARRCCFESVRTILTREISASPYQPSDRPLCRLRLRDILLSSCTCASFYMSRPRLCDSPPAACERPDASLLHAIEVRLHP